MMLLSFAVTYCTPDMIEPILQAMALLETQVMWRCCPTFKKIDEMFENVKSYTYSFGMNAKW